MYISKKQPLVNVTKKLKVGNCFYTGPRKQQPKDIPKLGKRKSPFDYGSVQLAMFTIMTNDIDCYFGVLPGTVYKASNISLTLDGHQMSALIWHHLLQRNLVKMSPSLSNEIDVITV